MPFKIIHLTSSDCKYSWNSALLYLTAFSLESIPVFRVQTLNCTYRHGRRKWGGVGRF